MTFLRLMLRKDVGSIVYTDNKQYTSFFLSLMKKVIFTKQYSGGAEKQVYQWVKWLFSLMQKIGQAYTKP